MRAVAAHAKILVLSAICLLVLVLSASADWSTPEAVAPDVPDAQILAEYTRHCIAVDGSGAVHVAWRCGMSSGDAIYYNARTPGLGWGTESFRVSAPSAYEFEEPSICCNTQGDVFVAWGINGAVYYRGYRVVTGWDADQALLDDHIPLGSYHPSVAMDDGGNVHAVWVRAMAPTADRVVYKKMTPSEGWSDALYLADGEGTTSGVAVVEDQGSLHVVWDRCCYGSCDSHVCYRGYTSGIGWDSTATVLDDVDGWLPSVAVDSQGCVHVVWIASPGEPVEVAYRRWAPSTGWDSLATTVSTVDGVSPEGPDVAVDDMGCVHVVWYESREGVYGGSWEVYERVLTPGIGWGDEVRLTDDPHSASVPHIASDNCGSIHMVYQSYLSVLYMVHPGTGSSGISPVANPSSAGISSLPVTASPNPFRGTTTIGYCLPERTFATLEIYNVAGQGVAKLVNGMGSEGGHSISWDGLDFVGRPLQPGVYFARLQIAGHVATKPIVLIR